MSALPLLRGELRVREPMSRHVSWRVGGPAARYYRPADLQDLCEFMRRLPADEAVLWLGLGSNLLVRDGGFAGTVISLHGVLDHIEFLPDGAVLAGSGVHCARLAKACAQRALAGGAFMIGIPGSVGGALAMNAGAWGGETWPHVRRVQVMYRSGALATLTPADFEIGYRHVRGPASDLCFVSAEFEFGHASDRDVPEELRHMLAERRASQPVGQPSCGSVFRNPQGDHAARLIEAAGLKGKRIGGALVSEKHANFILNSGDATAAEIEQLIALIQQEVTRQFHVQLTPEVRVVGHAAGATP